MNFKYSKQEYYDAGVVPADSLSPFARAELYVSQLPAVELDRAERGCSASFRPFIYE